MAWYNDVTLKFIELYQSEPAIWDPRDKRHKDKTKINDAWERISEEMGITVYELKKKKETLMAAFRLNHKKKLASLKIATTEEEIFKPIWIFYEPIAAFMADVYDCRSNSSAEEGGSSYTFQEKWNPLETGVEELSNDENSHQLPQSSRPALKRRHSGTPLDAPSDHNTHCATFLAQALTTMSNIITSQFKKDETDDDDCDIYGKLIAIKLRRYSEIDKLELMYEIDSLFLQKRIKLEPREISPDCNS